MLSQVTMREVIVDALGANGRVVVLSADLLNDDLLNDDLLNDDLLKDNLLMDNLGTACGVVGGSLIQLSNMRFARTTMSLGFPRPRAALMRTTAALLAAIWVSETQATPETWHARADGLVSAQITPAARNVVPGAVPGGEAGVPDIGRVQASRPGDRSVRFAQATIGGTENLQKPLETRPDQRKAVADGGAAECKPFKDDRAARLEQDLAAARRDVETQTALQSDGTVALLLQEALQFARESLKRERARAARLEQDLAAARHDVETQTVLATKASAEAAQVKQATKGGGAICKNPCKRSTPVPTGWSRILRRPAATSRPRPRW